MRKVKTIIL